MNYDAVKKLYKLPGGGVIQAMLERIHFFSGNRPQMEEKRKTPNEVVIIHKFDTDLTMIPLENFRGKKRQNLISVTKNSLNQIIGIF